MKTDDKTIVKDYFNAVGFERWRNIYGDGEVNTVQKNIRIGHKQTIETVVSWLKTDENLSQLTVCDAGCGTGSLAIPLAEAGATVYASDISEKMVGEAETQAKATLGENHNINFSVSDLEAITGNYHTVICLDVLIHYPDKDIPTMVKHLANCAESRFIISFAPKPFSSPFSRKLVNFSQDRVKPLALISIQKQRLSKSYRKMGLKLNVRE